MTLGRMALKRVRPFLLTRRCQIGGEHRQIRRRQIMGVQAGRWNPSQSDMLLWMGIGRTGRKAAHKGDHLDDDGFVVMQESRQGARDDHFAAKFLADLPDDGDCGVK
jgi:hypothetical protein